MLNLLPIFIVLCGLILLFRLKFAPIAHPVRNLRVILRSLRSGRAIKSLMLSLAGTLGVGNIVGVAFGISVGGAGSVFWLMLSALFAMIIKYAEVLISADKARGNEGGMICAVKESYGGKRLYLLYAALCVLLSLTMGTALQVRSAIEILPKTTPTLIIALLFTALTAISISGGGKLIEGVTAILIPTAALTYIVLCTAVIFKNSEMLPTVLRDVFASALRRDAAAGGIGGFMLSRAMREGFCRGLLSNEAGAGTSSIAHARNTAASPDEAGLFGMAEVFVDTLLLCPLSALAVLTARPSLGAGATGAEIISEAVLSLGERALPFLSFSIAVFAYSTVICWYYYGKVALGFLTKKRHGVYSLIFLFSVFAGALTSSAALITLSDYLLFFLSLISLSTVMKSLDRIAHLSRLRENKNITKDGYGKEG